MEDTIFISAKDLSPDYLEHHGVLGMKWGVRRYQTENGRLTSEGRERYSRKLNKYKDKSAKLKAKAATKRYKAEKYGIKEDRLRGRVLKTDITIGRADHLRNKAGRARTKALKYEKKAAKLDRKSVKIESLLNGDQNLRLDSIEQGNQQILKILNQCLIVYSPRL